MRGQPMKELAGRVGTNPQLLADNADIWCHPLLQTGEFTELAIRSQQVINAVAYDTRGIMRLQPYRAKAFLYRGSNERALSSAKGMCNVCTLDRIDDAITLMVGCLKDARPDDPEIVDRFKMEQLRGAGATTSPATTGSVLGGVRVDERRLRETYDAAMKRWSGKDYRSLLARGNLLLLADRPAEARQCFGATYQVASERDLPEAAESLARTMKAEDGASGRAAAWLDAYRAKQEREQAAKPSSSK